MTILSYPDWRGWDLAWIYWITEIRLSLITGGLTVFVWYIHKVSQ
jgi:hypothetical protein